ncbi:MAG: putative transporter, partial [Frankiales bacterium]|nr:putative transporter [Frankiales bacterium]
VMMTFGRTVGDKAVLRLGRNRSLTLLSAIGAVGLALGLLTDSVLGAAIGFGCLGLGLSVMVPIFFSAAGDGPGETGPKLAVVTTLGYLGFLLGPAALGPLASATSVHAALWALPVFTALAGGLGVTASRMRLTPH